MSTATQAPSRIAAIFAKAKTELRCAIVPFIVAGDPDAQSSEAILSAIAGAGADLVELGVPYSDPLADGPSIIAASQRALDNGASIDTVIDLAAKSPVPVVLFTYANPVVQYGIERLAERLAKAGVYGAIIPDLPLEETRAIAAIFATHGLEIPLLIAPTTPRKRAERIVAESNGFVYLVARLGVTGAGVHIDTAAIEKQIRSLREITALPIAVGFGISQPEHVSAISSIADGAIVGSALIDTYNRQRGPAAAEAAGSFITTLKKAAYR